MKETDKKISERDRKITEYLERAILLLGSFREEIAAFYTKDAIEIAKMIQLEEHVRVNECIQVIQDATKNITEEELKNLMGALEDD